MCRHAELLQSCLTLYSPVDCSLTGSSGYGIFQTRVLEWVAISYSKGQILTLTNKYVVQCSLGYYVLCPHYTEPKKHWGSSSVIGGQGSVACSLPWIGCGSMPQASGPLPQSLLGNPWILVGFTPHLLEHIYFYQSPEVLAISCPENLLNTCPPPSIVLYDAPWNVQTTQVSSASTVTESKRINSVWDQDWECELLFILHNHKLLQRTTSVCVFLFSCSILHGPSMDKTF